MTEDVVSKKLSRRELLILRALIEGESDRAIAKKLLLRESTVRKLVQALLEKLNRAQSSRRCQMAAGQAWRCLVIAKL